jgi:hypothetical protein
MSIDDKILIGTPHDFREVFKLYLEGLDADIVTEEHPYDIVIEDARWQGIAHASWDRSWAYSEPIVGFRETVSMSFSLKKTDPDGMRMKLIFALFPLIERLQCNVAYVANWAGVILRYRGDLLELKTERSFWHQDNLMMVPMPYKPLPVLSDF